MQTEIEVRKADIAETFALIRKVHPKHLALQCIKWDNGIQTLNSYPMSEVVADSIWSGSKCHAALLDVLHNSDCPFVAQLKQAMCDEYTDSNADELALYFEERQ